MTKTCVMMKTGCPHMTSKIIEGDGGGEGVAQCKLGDGESAV